MLLQYQNIKLLSFIACFKRHYSNGCIPKKHSVNKYRKKLGISAQRFNKYLQLAINSGLTEDKGTHIQFISLPKTINQLLGKAKKNTQIRFFSVNRRGYLGYQLVLPNTATMKDYEHLIKEEIFRVNLVQQQFKQNRSDKQNRNKKNLQRNVVSGKFHLSKLIGFSSTSALKLLRKLNSQKVIDRRVGLVKHDHNYLESNKIHFSKRYGTFFSNVGSLIVSFDNLGNSKYLPKENIANTEKAIQFIKEYKRDKELNSVYK